MYQSASGRPGPIGPVEVVLVIEVPADSPLLVYRTAELVDEYGRRIASSIPGLRVHQAVTTQPGQRRQSRPVGGLVIDACDREVRVDGRRLRLTYREFELLRRLAVVPYQPVSRADLVAEVWRDRPPPDTSRTVDTHVRRLRAKLGRFAGVLTTIRGFGYRFDPGADVHVRDPADTRVDHKVAVIGPVGSQNGSGGLPLTAHPRPVAT
ncbi:winged helix-turn-helix transcriptional regulator [Mycolicibacterium flavescens]|uniref:OmpR/PhoB-type domain-containing protein n=1 Tax=Mycolicibacterium flavescens TaxID=1776 RepID=A0A1E3RKY3_MYCFV|nr:winged helix-turn-helix domain-containing protein [Mycolicibacterium flavescens]MCV7279031.1 winged helix-turn-helix transcriptional regulator [Mycolicibacterium flavescens]ODQ90519.1 hypothetical protein BHQ18_10845 [Mycolicibacterium flavescens]